MPWKIEDVEKHRKGLTDKQKKQWIDTANSVRLKCINDGGDENTCDAKAIRIANGSFEEGAMEKWLENQTTEVQEKFNQLLAEKKKLEEQMPKWKMEVKSGIIPLIESNTKDNIVPIKIIQPGWGSSGYYPKEVLERDGSKVFTKGVKMFWNHQTVSEEMERPEGDLNDLAGEFISNARYEENGVAGEGLYADAKIFEQYKDIVKDLAPHIGVSIRATGIAEDGEVNGEKGLVIEELLNARSVDFVTVPGAGGKVIEMFESAGRKPKENKMEKDLIEANNKIDQLEKDLLAKDSDLEKANEKIEQFNEAALLKESADFVTAELAEIEMPNLTKERLAKKLSAKPILKEDKSIDQEAFKKVIGEAVKEELEYLGKIVGSGKIEGLGESTALDDVPSFEESMAKLYESQGKSKEEAERLAKIGAK